MRYFACQHRLPSLAPPVSTLAIMCMNFAEVQLMASVLWLLQSITIKQNFQRYSEPDMTTRNHLFGCCQACQD